MSEELTAEQVRETVEKHWHDLPAEYDMPEAAALPGFSYDWQAIADELNAAIDGGRIEQLETLVRNMWLTWKRLDLEGESPGRFHNGWKTFVSRMEELGLVERMES